MKTIDIHSHLLNPDVRFDRLFDRLTVRFFAKALGADPESLRARPYETYVDSMARASRESRRVDKVCLFGVDALIDEAGRDIGRGRTVCGKRTMY